MLSSRRSVWLLIAGRTQTAAARAAKLLPQHATAAEHRHLQTGPDDQALRPDGEHVDFPCRALLTGKRSRRTCCHSWPSPLHAQLLEEEHASAVQAVQPAAGPPPGTQISADSVRTLDLSVAADSVCTEPQEALIAAEQPNMCLQPDASEGGALNSHQASSQRVTGGHSCGQSPQEFAGDCDVAARIAVQPVISVAMEPDPSKDVDRDVMQSSTGGQRRSSRACAQRAKEAIKAAANFTLPAAVLARKPVSVNTKRASAQARHLRSASSDQQQQALSRSAVLEDARAAPPDHLHASDSSNGARKPKLGELSERAAGCWDSVLAI